MVLHRVMCPKYADRMANSVGREQTAPEEDLFDGKLRVITVIVLTMSCNNNVLCYFSNIYGEIITKFLIESAGGRDWP